MKKLLSVLLLVFACLVQAAPDKLTLITEPVDGNIMSWPGYRRMFHSIYGSPCGLTMAFFVPQNRHDTIQNASFTITVPDGVRVEEVLAQYADQGGVHHEYDVKYTRTQVPGGTRYDFPALDDFLKQFPKRSYTQTKELTFYFEQEEFDPAKEYKVVYQLTNAGKTGKQKHFILKFLPPIAKAPLPKQFHWQNFVSIWQLNVKNPELLKKISTRYVDANVASRALTDARYAHGVEVDQTLRKMGWTFYAPFYTTCLHVPRSHCQDVAVKPAIGADGKENDSEHCPTAALKNKALCDFAYRFEKEIAQDGDVLALDNEPFGYWKRACFCKECLDEFAKEFQLDRSKLTSPQVVQKQYEKEWIRWMCLQQYRATAQACQYFHQKYPHSPVVVYNYLVDFNNPALLQNQLKNCPQDPRDIDELVACHTPSVYSIHGRMMVEGLRQQSAHLKKPVGTAIGLDHAIGYGSAYMAQKDVLTPRGVYQKTVATAALGGTYVMAYAGVYFDGMMFSEVAQAMHEIAKLEDFYFGGTKDAPLTASLDPAWDAANEEACLAEEFSCISRGRGNDTLATLFNFSKEAASKLKMNYTGSLRKFYVSDPVSGRPYLINGSRLWTKEQFNGSFQLTIPMEGVAYVLISEKDLCGGKEAVPGANLSEEKEDGEAAQLAGRLEAEKNLLKEALDRGVSPQTFHNSSIAVAGDEVTITTVSQQVVISTHGGMMAEWKNLRNGKALQQKVDLSSFSYGKGSVWAIPEQPAALGRLFHGSAPVFRPYNANISDEGKVLISFGYMDKDSFLYKDFEFDPDKPEIKVSCGYRNLSLYNNACQFRFRMCIPGPAEKKEYAIGGRKITPVRVNSHYGDTEKLSGAAVPEDYCGKFTGRDAVLTLDGVRYQLTWNDRSVQNVFFYQDKTLNTMELTTVSRKVGPLKSSVFHCTVAGN